MGLTNFLPHTLIHTIKKMGIYVMVFCLGVLPGYSLDAQESWVGKRAPAIIAADLDGDVFNLVQVLKSMKDEEKILIEFWTLECKICKNSQMFIRENLKNRTIQPWLILLPDKTYSESKDPEKEIARNLRSRKISFRCLVDKFSSAGKEYGVVDDNMGSQVPQVFIINKQREIVYHALGFSESDQKSILAFLASEK